MDGANKSGVKWWSVTYLDLDDQASALILNRSLDGLNSAFQPLDSGILAASLYQKIYCILGISTNLICCICTYNGGATSFALIGTASMLFFSPVHRAFLIASIPAGV